MAELYLTLGIYGSKHSNEEISKILGLDPSEAWKKNDIKFVGPRGKPKAKIKIKEDMWLLKSNLLPEENLESHLDNLFRKLGSKHSQLVRFAKYSEIELSIAYYYKGANPGLHISKHYLKAIADYGFSLDLDIYSLPAD